MAAWEVDADLFPCQEGRMGKLTEFEVADRAKSGIRKIIGTRPNPEGKKNNLNIALQHQLWNSREMSLNLVIKSTRHR